MKKTISAFIAAVCVAAGTVSLAACGNGNQTHSHVWSQTYTQEGDRHYQTCSDCDEKNYASHSYNADGICVCGKQKEEQGEVKPPVTKLAVELSGSSGQSVTLNFNIVANGVKKTVTQAITFIAATQTVEIDLTAAGVANLGAYNGNTNSYTDTALFDNPDGADGNGDNYISLDLTDNAVEFSIKFTGIYGK